MDNKTPAEEDTVTIPGDYFRALLDDRKVLNALYAGGVDNWDGYDFALEEHYDD